MRIIFWSRELIKSALWLERSLCLPLHRTSMFFLDNKVEVKVAMWDCGRAWHEKVRSSVGAWRRHRPHSSTLAWKIPWTEEPSRLQSMGSLGVRHDWVTSLSLFTFMHWRRQWHPTPVLLPGKSHGQRSLVGCRLWGRTESDTTEAT